MSPEAGHTTELVFLLTTAPQLWTLLQTATEVEDQRFVDRIQGWPFTLPDDGGGGRLRLNRQIVTTLGCATRLRRWAARWGGTYDHTIGVLTGCRLGLDAECWRSFTE